MPLSETRQRADAFHRLHTGPEPLVLVNAWDAVSARIVERAGATAIGTTSAGMAWSLGYADGERMPAGEMLAACARICRVASVPVSVDIEQGFGDSTQAVADVAGALIDRGAAGINIEDGTRPGTRELMPPQVLCERIAAIRKLDARFFITRAPTPTSCPGKTRRRVSRRRNDARAFMWQRVRTASSCPACPASTKSRPWPARWTSR